MKYLSEEERKIALKYFDFAAKIAQQSSCLRAKCGSVIVLNNEIIGRGFNSPPRELESQRRCLLSKDDLDKKVTDKTCCVHAEQRAIIDALRNNPEKIQGSRLYFIRLDSDFGKTHAGKPYCTHCSKLVLDVSIGEFVLWRAEGIRIYDSAEYNEISFRYME